MRMHGPPSTLVPQAGAATKPRGPGRERTGLLLLLVLGLLLRLIALDRSIWVDETFTLAFTTSWSQVFEYCRTHVHPPLYFLLVRGSRLFVGETTFLRALFLPAGIFSLFYIWKLARLRGGREVGLVALFLAAVSPMHIRYSLELRPYPLVLLFSAMSTYYLFRILARGERHDRIMFIVATAANLYTHYFGFFLYAAHAAILILHGLRSRKLLEQALPVFLPGLLYLPWAASALAFAARAMGDGGQGAGIPTHVYSVYLFLMTMRDFAGGDRGATFLAAVLLLYGIIRLRGRPPGGIAADLLMILLPIAFVSIVHPVRAVSSRYFLVIYPLWITLVGAGAAGVGALAARALPPGKRAAPVVAMALLLPLVLFLPGERPVVWLGTDRWSDLDRVLAEKVEPADAIVAVPETFTVLKVYLPGADPVVAAKLRERIMVGGDFSDPIARVDPKYERLWVIVVGRGQRPAAIRAALEPLSVESRDFHMVESEVSLYLLERDSASR